MHRPLPAQFPPLLVTPRVNPHHRDPVTGDPLDPDMVEAILAEERARESAIVMEALSTSPDQYSGEQIEALATQMKRDPFYFAVRITNLMTFTKLMHRRLVLVEQALGIAPNGGR